MHMDAHREVVIVHSSDLHLGTDDSFSDKDRLEVLPKVLAAAAEANADIVLLAGDSFDNHRQPINLLERATEMLRDYAKPVVILPGNHDPLTPDSVYRRGGLGLIDNVSILGLNVDEAAMFSQFELEIWGHPHFDYSDMSPLANPRPRTTRWQLAAAHGLSLEPLDARAVELAGRTGELFGALMSIDPAAPESTDIQRQREALAKQFDQLLSNVDACLLPVLPIPAPPHVESGTAINVDGEPRDYMQLFTANAFPFNVTGQMPPPRTSGKPPM